MRQGTSDSAAPVGQFATTHWSVVLAARDPAAPQAAQALEDLCGIYWYPLYAFVRRRGFSADEAQDLTQEFFLRLLEKDYLRVVDRSKGRFRSFLRAAMEHFLSNELDRARAQKRGGDRRRLSLDFRDAEGKYQIEPADGQTPEALFERRWALTLLDAVLQRLQDEHTAAGKGELFACLKDYLVDSPEAAPYAEVATEVRLSEAAVKMAVHRLRKRYRQLLHEEIAQTVADPAEVEEEIQHLFRALGS